MGRSRSAALLLALALDMPLSAQEVLLQLESPERVFRIEPHSIELLYPGMPVLPARWTGENLEGAGVRWQAGLDYVTRQRNPITLHAAFERAGGGPCPGDLFRFPAAPGQSNPGSHGSHGSDRDCPRGGNLRLSVLIGPTEAVLGGPPLRVRLGEQPDPQRVVARLACEAERFPDGTEVSAASLTHWLRAVACQESGLRQNATREAPAQYQAPGEPRMNLQGDGGIGIMQRTPHGFERELKRFEIQNWLWDWTANVDEGKRLFLEERLRNSAYGYPAQVARSAGFLRAVESTQRERQRLGLARLRRIAIPPFRAEQLLLDAVRGYNGFAGQDPFGLRLHEFRLKTRPGASGLLLELADPGPDPEAPGELMAWAVWEQVPPMERPVGGDRAYVDHVRARVNQPEVP